MDEYTKKISRFEFVRDPENGCLIGPDECHYETEAEAMYYGQLGLCGCGRPQDVHAFLIRCLATRSEEHGILDLKKIKALISEKPEIVAEFVGHFICDKHLTEHGGSVYGSWLTERGKQVLEIGPMVDDDGG